MVPEWWAVAPSRMTAVIYSASGHCRQYPMGSSEQLWGWAFSFLFYWWNQVRLKDWATSPKSLSWETEWSDPTHQTPKPLLAGRPGLQLPCLVSGSLSSLPWLPAAPPSQPSSRVPRATMCSCCRSTWHSLCVCSYNILPVSRARLLPLPSEPIMGPHTVTACDKRRKECISQNLAIMTHWKRPWCWDRRQKEKRATENEMVGWHHWCKGHELGQTLGVGEGQVKPGMLQPTGSCRVGHSLATEQQQS